MGGEGKGRVARGCWEKERNENKGRLRKRIFRGIGRCPRKGSYRQTGVEADGREKSTRQAITTPGDHFTNIVTSS